MDPMAGLAIQLTLLLMLLGLIAFFKAVLLYRRVRDGQRGEQPHQTRSTTQQPGEHRTVPGAGRALMAPPALTAALTQMQAVAPRDRYRVPLGWYLAPDGPRVAFTPLVRGTNHIALSGASDSGKDTLAASMLLALALQHPPQELQFAIIDGKGLDFVGWGTRAHTWRLALRPSEIAPALQALTEERERRADILRHAGSVKWDEHTGGDLPLLVVFVSELTLLQDAVGVRELEAWLNSELTTSRAFGIRYLVASQTFSNFGTRWRSQIGLFLAGYQPSASQDQPNTGLTTAEIRAAGGTPPSELPTPAQAAGVFTAVEGREVITVRGTALSSRERQALLERLPDATRSSALHMGATPLPGRSDALHGRYGVAPEARESDDSDPPRSGSGSAVAVTPEERRAILHARDVLSAAGDMPSRRAICSRVFNGATGGAAYRKVQTVLDEAEARCDSPGVMPDPCVSS